MISATFPPITFYRDFFEFEDIVYSMGSPITKSSHDCIQDKVHKCDYETNIFAPNSVPLIGTLSYRCNNGNCGIYEHSDQISTFIITADIFEKYFYFTQNLKDGFSQFYMFMKEHIWVFISIISLTGANSMVGILYCIKTLFIGDDRRLRWFPLTMRDFINLGRCLTCRAQNIDEPEQFSLQELQELIISTQPQSRPRRRDRQN